MRLFITTIAILLLAGQAQASTLSIGGNIDIASPAGSIGNISASSGDTLLLSPPAQISIAASQPVQSAINYPPVLSTYVSGSISYSNQYSGGDPYSNSSQSLFSNQGDQISIEFAQQAYGYYAVADSEAGNLHAKASTTYPGSATGYDKSTATAAASFSDWFVITGGNGQEYAGINAISTGSLTGGGFGQAYSRLEVFYSAQNSCSGSTSSNCESWQLNRTVISQSHYAGGDSTLTSQDTLSGDFAFAFDQPFKISMSLIVNAANGGSANYFNSSTLLGFYLPNGAELRTLAGNIYAPVPEPKSWALLLAGLGLLELRRRKRA